MLRLNTVIYCVWTLLYIASEHCYILSEHCYMLRLNTVICCVWTLLYIVSEHCYMLRLNTVIYYIWTLLYIASEHCYILCLNTVIYCVWTLLYIVSQKLRKQTIFNINTHFKIRTTYVAFQNSTTLIPQGNLTPDHEIKHHIWQKKLIKAVQAVQFPLSQSQSEWQSQQHKMKHNNST